MADPVEIVSEAIASLRANPPRGTVPRSRDFAEIAIGALRDAGLLVEWQSIETAPRDGTVIDVWLGDCPPEDQRFYCVGDGLRSANWHWNEDKFRPFIDGLRLTTFVQPTHWMPLANPPEGAE